MVSVKETETLDKIKYFVKLYNLDEQYDFLDDISIFFWRCWNWIQWTCLSGLILYRLLARRASRCPGTPLERKMDAFGRPNSMGKGKLLSIIS
jgi:hypothetical protein